MKVADLAHELRCTVKEVQSFARRLDITAKSSDHALRPAECTRIRDLVARERELVALRPSDGNGNGNGSHAAGSEALYSTRNLPRATVKRDPAAPRDESGREVWFHQSFFDWLHDPSTDERQRRRARLVLWQFFSRGQPNNVKSLQGPGHGWLRTRLGGTNGNQFYLWWAPAGAMPVAGTPLTGGQVLLRAVRHHDANDQLLEPGDPAAWLRIHVKDVFDKGADYRESFTEQQSHAASAPTAVRLIKGHPGTGKTTALWLSTSYADGHRALYITYSRRLAAESEQHFKSLGPTGMSIDVLTFEELLWEFDDAAATATRARHLPPDEAAERMRVMLGGYQQRRAPWEGHESELYAELHAHYVGRALPVSFRGVAAATGPTLEANDYVKLREEVLGAPAARAAASIGDYLRRTNGLRELMPGPLRAREALDALGSGDPNATPKALPARFRDIDWIFVDEVQDLTLVESLLLIELAARIGRERGRLPGFIAAGDEGQTVRPTDFEWGPLADLLFDRLGMRSEYELQGNLRSPRNIATVINRSWELYRRLEKAERPRGYAEADVEETAVGRIIYTRVRSDEEAAELLGAFARTPGSALVHPGYRVPAPWRRAERSDQKGAFEIDLWTSDAAKGLDFQVVGVLDAGRQLDKLHDLAAEAEQGGRIFGLWARTLADQLRVALSRATDTLVLVDRVDGRKDRGDGQGDSGTGKARLYELCRGPDGAPLDGFLEEMEPRELGELLAREDADAQSLVLGYLQEIPKLMQDRPARALRQARNATGLLGHEKTPGAVVDTALRKQVYRLRGVAALLSAVDAYTPDSERGELFGESNRWLHRAGYAEAARAALRLRDIRQAHQEAGFAGQDQALQLAASLEKLKSDIPEADTVFRLGIVKWCAASAAAPPPAGVPPKKRLADAVGELAAQLGGRHPDLYTHREIVRRRVAQALFDEGHARDALNQYELLAERDRASEARCHEELGDFAAAADLYEQAGDTAAALRCARRVPDFPRALRLAATSGDDASFSLDWIHKYRELIAEAGAARVQLTAEEHQALTQELERAVRVTGAAAPARRAPRKSTRSRSARDEQE